MSTTIRHRFRPLEIDKVLYDASRLCLKYYLDIIIYTLLNNAVYLFALLVWDFMPATEHPWLAWVVQIGLLKLFPFLSTAVLFVYINEHENRRSTSLRKIIERINTVLIPLAFTVLLVTTINIVGLLFFILPGIFFIIMFSQSYFTVLFTDETNPFSALSRSEHMTKHNRLRIFGLFTLFSIVYLVIIAYLRIQVPPFVLPMVDTVMSMVLLVINYAIWRSLRSNF